VTTPPVSHQFETALIPGRLIRRYKRFLARVELNDGTRVTAHCPNSGSMLGAIEEGAPVFLSPAEGAKRKTAFTWEMIRINGGWVGINTGLPNKLVALAAQRRALAVFQGVTEVRREVRLGERSRIDLLVESALGPMYVEVKNVSLVRDRVAEFPDSVTARGAKHLEELTRVVRSGGRAAMVYLVQRQDADLFGPAKTIDPAYARLYLEARAAGVLMTAVEAEVTPKAISLTRELPLLI